VSIRIQNGLSLSLGFFLVLMFASCKNDKTGSLNSSGDPAIDKISALIQENGNDPELYFQRAKLLYEKGNLQNTIIDLQQAIALDSMNPDYFHLLSDAFLDYANPDEAMRILNRVLAMYPERIASLLKMAELKFILEDYDGSILTVNEIVRLDPQNDEAYFMLGMNFKSLGDVPRAINAFQTAVEMNSKLTDAWIILGELYEAKKDPMALKYYESAILSNPASMQALHAKAYYLQNHGDIPGALTIYRNIIITDKSYEDAYLNAGLLYLEVDSLDKAFEQFDLLAGVAPTNPMGFYMRGIANEKKGKLKDALRDYESALNLNRNDEKVVKAIEDLKRKQIK